MSESKIEWLAAPGFRPEVWNPVTGCTKVSQGCKHCYAERWAGRQMGQWKGRDFTDVRTHDERLQSPLSWKHPRMVFVNSMSDLFHEAVPLPFVLHVLAMMALTPRHRYVVLTKRPSRAKAIMGAQVDWADTLSDHAYLVTRSDEADVFVANAVSGASQPKEGPMGWPLPNLWLGVSVEDQATAGERIPVLLQTPAAARFISAEPLLGPVDLGAVHQTVSPGFFGDCLQWHHRPYSDRLANTPYPVLDWVIVGGESGPGARPCNVTWIRSIVQQCAAANTTCFVKQLGSRPVLGGPGAIGEQREIYPGGPVLQTAVMELDIFNRPKGGDMSEWPEDLRVRQWPEGKR